MEHYYNEIDPYPAQWLRNLMAAGHIPAGDVDERSITDVQPDDLRGYVQCHFFAGIGGWPLALKLAGWPVERPVWTGSCPCQPFSNAGKQLGYSDPRHLWPDFLRLIQSKRPATVFGEQVESKAGRSWLNAVRADMEASRYGFGAADLCAPGVGAPHLRQRIFFAAISDAESNRWAQEGERSSPRHTDGVCELRQGSSPDWRLEPPPLQLADGVSRQLEQLRAYGNALIPPLAAEFVSAYMECRP